MTSEAIFILEVTILIVGSGICSGLNVSVMSLNLQDLKRQAKLGNQKAQKILPFRQNAHLTLAAILLTNVAFASASSIVLAGKMNGFIAAAISTILLVVFGELIPQAIFTRNALTICSYLVPFLQFIKVITYPLAKPLQLILDKWFGSEKAFLHTRNELSLIIGEHINHDSSELDEDEVEIIKGALQLSEKRVSSIMTPINETFLLKPNEVINKLTINKIKQRGFSRIPVIDIKKNIVYGVILMKELVDIDIKSNKLAASNMNLYKTTIVGANTALDTMFRNFIKAKGHLIVVEKKHKIVGIVTIEDLIEEILGHEIEDEKDNSSKKIYTN
jgi:metal transporter CNNM